MSSPLSPHAKVLSCSSIVGLCVLLAAAITPPAKTRLDLEVTYTGAETVDEAHPITVLLFDGPDLSGGSQMIAAGHQATNGKPLRFSGLPETVYAVAVLDPSGSFTGLSGMIPGSLIGVYSKDESGQPAPIEVGGRTKLAFEFDDTHRLPGSAEGVVPPAVREAQGIVEIRTYTIREGKRDEFIDFFVRRTLEAQERSGLRVVGQFRSLEDENTFVWMRAYESQAERVEQLRSFYLGPDWLEVQAEAMDLIADTRVVLVEPTDHSEIR